MNVDDNSGPENGLVVGDELKLKHYDPALGAWRVEKNGVLLKAHVFIKVEIEVTQDLHSITSELYSLMVNPFKAWAMSNGVDTGKQGQDERVQQQALKPGKRKKSQRMTRAEQLSLRHPVSVQDAAKALMLSELEDTKSQLGDLHTELQVITKAFLESYPLDSTPLLLHDCFSVQKTPDEMVFARLLDSPFTISPTTPSDQPSKPDSESKQGNLPGFKVFNSITDSRNSSEITLAPAKLFRYKYLIQSHLNPNAVSLGDLRAIETLAFDVLGFNTSNFNINAMTSSELSAHPDNDLSDSGSGPNLNSDHEAPLPLYPLALIVHMFSNLGLLDTFNIPLTTLERFLITVFFRYRDVPFHNFYHAFNVTQTMYYFLHTCGARSPLSQLEILAMMISALTHDCDHPGLNNSFQHKAGTRVCTLNRVYRSLQAPAMLHQKSTLENHHLIQYSNEKEALKLYIRHLILATDLSLHGVVHRKLVERKKHIFKQITKKGQSNLEEEDRILIMVVLMKCSDLSNEIRPSGVSQKWANRVLMEFFAQAQKERQLNLPVTPFMDQHKMIIAKEQMNFISHLCMPLYENIAGIFPTLIPCVDQLNTNRSQWEKRLTLFFSDNPEEEKKLSNKSVWDDTKQVKGSSKIGLKSLLSTR